MMKISVQENEEPTGSGYILESFNKVSGAGFDFKLGAILRPFEDSPLRLGLAIHTPTFYNLTWSTSARSCFRSVSGR